MERGLVQSPWLATARARIEVADRTPRIDQQMIDDWADGRLRAALQRVPPGYRMILLLREIEGLPTKEVAVVTGYSEANVKTRLRRARMMLRRQLTIGVFGTTNDRVTNHVRVLLNGSPLLQ